MRRSVFLSSLLAASIALSILAYLFAPPAHAGQQTSQPAVKYPSKPVRLIVTWGAGGGTDRRFRILTGVIEKYLGAPMVVVNRPGGGGTVGTAEAAVAPPDGYTLLVWHSGPMVVSPVTLGVPYDPIKDFEYILQTHAYTRSIDRGANAPYKDFNEFVKHAKANAGKIKAGLGDGAMGEGHIWLESLFADLGIKVTYVPFNSAAEAAAAAAGGHVDISIGTIPASAPLVKQGKIAPMLNSYAEDVEGYPGLKRYGLEKFHYAQRNGLAAPKGTPVEIQKVVRDAVLQAMKDPSFLELAKKSGEPPETLSGEELLQATKRDLEMMKQTVAELKRR